MDHELIKIERLNSAAKVIAYQRGIWRTGLFPIWVLLIGFWTPYFQKYRAGFIIGGIAAVATLMLAGQPKSNL